MRVVFYLLRLSVLKCGFPLLGGVPGFGFSKIGVSYTLSRAGMFDSEVNISHAYFTWPRPRSRPPLLFVPLWGTREPGPVFFFLLFRKMCCLSRYVMRVYLWLKYPVVRMRNVLYI